MRVLTPFEKISMGGRRKEAAGAKGRGMEGDGGDRHGAGNPA